MKGFVRVKYQNIKIFYLHKQEIRPGGGGGGGSWPAGARLGVRYEENIRI